MDERTRWNDDRLDDFHRDFVSMKATVARVPVLEEQLKGIAEDAAVARRNTHELRNDWQAAAVQQELERKKDRRWLVGTILSAAGLIVAAIAVLQGFMG